MTVEGVYMAYQYDLIVIGGGPGGYVPAIRAAKEGLRTAVVEQDALGGTCLNRGCIPTKTLLHTAELYEAMQHCEGIGIHAEGVSLSMETLKARKEQVTDELRKGIEASFKKLKITQLRGTGTIVSAHEVLIDGKECCSAEHILIAAGSRPGRVPIPGLELPGILDSDRLLERAEAPFAHLIIIGGGVIGLEFASLYQALGSKVTVLEAMDRLLGNLDREFGQSMKMLLKKRGADVHTSASVQKIEKDGSLFTCTFAEKEQVQTVTGDGVLVAVGRKPCTEGLFAEGVRVEMERGRIVVNKQFQTSVPSIYAVGDVIGGIQLAHMASAEGLHAVAHMTGKTAEVRLDLVPSCVYTNPELASVGITADEAKKQGVPAKSVKYPMSANGKSVLSNQERGFIKVVYREEDHRVLGAQLMCARATDLVSFFTAAIANELTVEDLRKTMFPHPTFSEGIGEALGLVE